MYYPALLNIKDKPCLVVGAGSVGSRKASGLLRGRAIVTVVAEEFLVPITQEDRIRLKKRPYEKADVDGMFLVFAATNNPDLNKAITQDAKNKGALACVADDPEKSDFIVPSVVRQGDLTFTVSTSGSSPALSRKIRRELEHTYGPEYAALLELMKRIRKEMLSESHDPHTHKEIFTNLVYSNLTAMIAEGDIEGVNNTISQIVGRKVAYNKS